MKPETQTKAVAGSVAALIASFIPLILSMATSSPVSADALLEVGSALTALAGAGVAALVGWATVYFAPRNKPVDGS